MKRILATAALALLTAPTAFAADTRLELPLRGLIDSPQARAALPAASARVG